MNTQKSILWVTIFILTILLLPVLGASAKEGGSPAIPKSEVLSKVSKLQVPFIPNQGQMDERVKYYARSLGGTVFVTGVGEILYSLPKRDEGGKGLRGWVLKEELLGGRVRGVKGEEEAPTRVSYFIGNDTSRWRSDMPTYWYVRFGEVYEGIEVKLRVYGKSVEKLFYVRAGVDPGVIRLRLSGAESLGVNKEGELEVGTGLGEVKFSKPVAYQEVEGERKYVEVSYQVEGSDYGFKLGGYDRGRELVIDPLLQSTYLGGSFNDEASSIAIGSGGNIYVAGITSSTNFPGTSGGAQPSFGGGSQDVFVTRLNPTLTTILQSTYLGGSGSDAKYYGTSIAIDASGNVYVAGTTSSTNFPGTSGGAQPSFGGGLEDVFVTRLNPTLTTILQSTYLGGSGDDEAYSIAIGSGGNIYVAGITSSTNFPGTSGGAQPSFGGGLEDVFVTRLNPTLTTILQSTYLGGSDYDYASSIAIDSVGNVYVTGSTVSSNFPGTTGGAQSSYRGSNEAYITRLNPTLTTILQSTYLGGSGIDIAESIAIGSGGTVYVAGGYTTSTDFPGTTGGAQPSKSGSSDADAFVARLNPTLTTILQSTYLGGSDTDYGLSIAIDSVGNVYVSGYTSSTNFPGTTGGAQPSKSGSQDAFVARLNPTLTTILQSTYLGGSFNDWASSIAIGSGGDVYVAGITSSTDFPGTSGGAQPSKSGLEDVFVARLDSSLAAPPPPIAPTLVSPSGTTATTTPTYTWNAVGNATDYYLWVTDSSGNRIQQWYTAAACGCGSGTGTCSVTPATVLNLGAGQWWAQAKNSGGTSPWSAGKSFTIQIPLGAATPLDPVQGWTITAATTPYTWTEVTAATWYYLSVDDPSGNRILQWYTAAAAGCNSGKCTVTPGTTLGSGVCKWKVQTWNSSSGYGPWSTLVTFTINVPDPKATLFSPTDTITTATPTYIWNAVSAPWYQLSVDDTTGNKIRQWYTAAQANCGSGSGNCFVTPATALAAGAAKWKVQTWVNGAAGPWSDEMAITVNVPEPKATLVSPTGTIVTATPTYIWNAVSGSAWYQLSVDDTTGNKIRQWYTAAQANCSSGTSNCSVTPATTLGSGGCKWKVQTWVNGAAGPWSNELAFTAIVPEPPKPPTLVSPVGTITTTSPTYTWSEVSNATDYYLWVNDSTGNRIQQWYTNDICGYGSGLCSLTPATTLNPGTGQWWVQAKNSAGSSAWSTPLSFTVQGSTPGLPGAATLLSPTGSIATKTPTYTWKPVSNSTWYYLWVNDSSGNRIQQWYTAAAVGAGSGTCSVTPAITLNSGAGRWWIQTWTSSGAGPWSAPMNFTVP